MGGVGSGNRNQSGKNTTEDALPLDIRRLRRAGVFIPGRLFSWQWTINDKPIADIRVRVEIEHAVLIYRYRPRGATEWQNVEQTVYLDRTGCTYGGTRSWWRCPSCSKRVAVLYGAGKCYACRYCYQLAYACQRERADDRAARRADRIRRRLGWPVGIFNPSGGKPKGMHRKTYERLNRVHDAYLNRSLSVIAQRFGFLEKRLGDFED